MDKLKVSAVLAFEPFLHRHARDEGADTLRRLLETGVMDDQTEEELTEICTKAVERFLKEMSATETQPVASLKVTISTVPNETTVVLLEQRGR